MNAAASPVVEKNDSSFRESLILVGVLSAVVPGLGQFLRQRWVAGCGFFLAAVTISAASAFLGFWRTPLGLMSAVLALFLLGFLSSAHAAWKDSRGRRPTYWIGLLFLVVAFLSSIYAFQLIARAAGFRGYEVPSTAMEPTVHKGDHVVADLHSFRSRPVGRGQVVVIWHEDSYLLKRVIGLPGDRVEGRGGEIFVNAVLLREDYIEHTGQPPSWMQDFDSGILPRDQYFVMGDNRDYSYDSRHERFGTVAVGDIRGRALYIASPGSTRHGTFVH